MAETDIVPEKENYPMKPALIIGSTCVDVIINIHHLPKTEEDIHPTSQSMAIGGCAFNAAYMVRLLNAPHTFITPVGGRHLRRLCGKAHDPVWDPHCRPGAGKRKRLLLLPGGGRRGEDLHVLSRSRIYLPEGMDGAVSGRGFRPHLRLRPGDRGAHRDQSH